WPVVNGRETMRRYSADGDTAADRAHGGFDFYGHPDHRAWIWLRPHEPPAEAPDREYPFWLSTGEVLEHSGSGSLTRRIPVLHGAVPHAYAEINRQDAEKLGIRNGEMIELVSRRGSLRIEARIDYRAQPTLGHVFIPSFDDQLAVNLLTLDATCPLSGQPDAKCAVRIDRLTGRSAR
ncbi:MAG: molybdopterin dinucleotide binding domain-containing protein, partial [Gemmatimonadota bacterium]